MLVKVASLLIQNPEPEVDTAASRRSLDASSAPHSQSVSVEAVPSVSDSAINPAVEVAMADSYWTSDEAMVSRWPVDDSSAPISQSAAAEAAVPVSNITIESAVEQAIAAEGSAAATSYLTSNEVAPDHWASDASSSPRRRSASVEAAIPILAIEPSTEVKAAVEAATCHSTPAVSAPFLKSTALAASTVNPTVEVAAEAEEVGAAVVSSYWSSETNPVLHSQSSAVAAAAQSSSPSVPSSPPEAGLFPLILGIVIPNLMGLGFWLSVFGRGPNLGIRN
jgi:hypothetical protein